MIKTGSRSQLAAKSQVDVSAATDDSNPKPLAATLLQEFQNLKDKFKNEDDTSEKGMRFS
jgi:hypothetical protein